MQLNSIFHLFACLLKSRKANYKVNTNKRRKQNKHTHTKTKLGSLYYFASNNNSISAITPTIMKPEKRYVYIHSEQINTSIIKKGLL